MKRILYAVLLTTVGLSSPGFTADNFRQSTSGGTVTTFRSTDTGGVHVPHVNATILGGSTSDATAANQTLQITQETAINTLLGLQADAACATDNGTCTLAALVKRLNQRVTTINTTLGTPFQAGGALAANQSVNISQINAVTPLMGNGVTGTGSQRVTVASDNTPFPVKFDQTTPGTTNAVAPIAGQNGVAGGAGASSATTQRVAIATDANVVALPAAGTSVVGTKAAGTAGATSALVGNVYNTTAPTLTDGQQAGSQADTVGSQYVNTTGRRTTYSSVGIITLAASATDVFTITGSASKTVGVKRVQCAGTATAATATNLGLMKRSTANSGGTSAAGSINPHDSSSAAGTATVLSYTANPTVGTAVGYVRLNLHTFTTSAGAIPSVPVIWDFTTRNSQPIILRGTGQVLAVNLVAISVTGGVLNCDIEWDEWTD